MWRMVAPTPLASSTQHRDERDVREPRHAHREAGDPPAPPAGSPTAPAGRPGRPARSIPRRGAASRAGARGRAARSARRGRRGRERAAPRPPRGRAPRRGRSSAIERCSRCGPVDPERDRRRERRRGRSRPRGRRIARPNAVTRNSGTSAADVERRAQRVDGGGDVEVDRHGHQADAAMISERDRHRAQARRPRRGACSGRAIRILKHEQADRHHHRAGTSPTEPPTGSGSVAVSRDVRDDELRRRARVRPDRERVGPLHRVAVDRDRPPVDQVPAGAAGAARSGTTSVSGFAGERLHRGGRELVTLGVGDRDDREPRLDRLVVGERDMGRRRRRIAFGVGEVCTR